MISYRVVLMDLPPRIKSFVTVKDGFATIVLNSRLSCETWRKCYRHELEHLIKGDFDGGCADAVERDRH